MTPSAPAAPGHAPARTTTRPRGPRVHPAPTTASRPSPATTSVPSTGRGPVPRTPLDAPWDRLRLHRTEQRRSADEHARALEALHDSPVPTDPAGPWAAALVRACVETLLGARPATQLQRWLTPELYDAVSRRAGLAVRILGRATNQQRPRVLSHHAQVAVDERSAEVCVVLHDGTKVRAVAVKLEAFRGRWRAGALEIG